MQEVFIYPKLRPKTKKELANEYGISRDTIRRYCLRIGIVTVGLLSIKDLKQFYNHYDVPNGE